MLESSGGWSFTRKAFIFSISNKEELDPFVSKVRNPEAAIHRLSELVHALVLTSSLLIMPKVTATHTHALAGPTLLLLQHRTRKQSWPGLTASHLMRWRYFILTLLNKYKKNHFIITAKKHAAILTYLLPSKKCTSQCIFLDNVGNLSFFLFLIFVKHETVI